MAKITAVMSVIRIVAIRNIIKINNVIGNQTNVVDSLIRTYVAFYNALMENSPNISVDMAPKTTNVKEKRRNNIRASNSAEAILTKSLVSSFLQKYNTFNNIICQCVF